MEIEIENIESLKDASEIEAQIPLPEKKVDELGRAYATGKRKNAVARVWLKAGSGIIKINNKVSDDYFARPVLRMLINQPLVAADRVDQFDIICSVTGGGLSGTGWKLSSLLCCGKFCRMLQHSISAEDQFDMSRYFFS